MTKVLEVRDCDVVYSSGFAGRTKKQALSNVSVAVGGPEPAITAVVGESGSGKTTLIRLLLGFQTPTAGSVVYDGVPVEKMSRQEARLFRREVQAIFQDPFGSFNPFYTVDHPLTVALRAFNLVQSRAEARERIAKTLKSVGLDPAMTLGRYPHQLSGGQRQRVMIARALLLEPQIILADEPVSMVDASLRSSILEILYGLNRDLGISIIYVTHDLTTAYQVADSIVVLSKGHIVEVGASDHVIHDPRHPYTRALIDAVPSPDPEQVWMTAGAPAENAPQAETETRTALYRTHDLRAVARPWQSGETPVTAAEIQLAVSREKHAT